MTTAMAKWEVGQTVDVQSRTWAGINKPGGCAKITKIHNTVDGLTVESIDVKYVLGGGFEKGIDPAIVSPFETLERGGRKRRGRDFLLDRADTVVKKVKQAMVRKQDNKSNSNAPVSLTAGTNKSKPAAARRTQARKTKEQLDQSTSPSTPITPEHPSVSRAAATASSKTSRSSVSVPAFVIADRAVEVSPLPLDRAVVEPKKNSTVAPRGLFGCSGSSTKLKKQSSSIKEQEDDRKVAAAKLSSASIPPPATKKVKAKTTTPANAAGSISDDNSTFHKTAKDVSKAHSAAMKNSMTMNKQGRNFLNSNRFGANKKAPLADRKPASKQQQQPDQYTAGGATTAAAKKAGSTATITKTSLKNVFDYELRKAKQFLDEVCRAPCEDTEAIDDPALSKENRLNTSASEGEEDSKPAANNNRREEFLNLFRILRPRFDDDDGAMEEAAFRILVDRRATKTFSLKELDDNLDFLVREGKLMKSDGILYIID